MSDSQAASPKQDSQKQEQKSKQSSVDEGKKRSAPENPPATPPAQRTSSVNFNEDERREASKQQNAKDS